MSEKIAKNVTGDAIQLKTEDGRLLLETDFPSLDASVERARQKYLRDKADYFDTFADDPEIEKKTKRWQRSSYHYLRWAGTLFNVSAADTERRRQALEIMDKITKDSNLRYHNLCRHADYMIEHAKEEDKNSVRDAMDEQEYAAGNFAMSAVNTQNRFQEMYKKGETYVPSEIQHEIKAAARMEEFREKVFPRDQIYIPGRIIPPYPVPKTERVPYKPDPYELAKAQPVEAYEFDPEIKEIVIKKGYVSPDGLIDDQSIQYDIENGKCTMKYRGGIPVTWDFWKPKDTRDVPDKDSWVAEYLIRSYQQMLADEEFGILKRRDFEDEIPDYNRKPSGSG